MRTPLAAAAVLTLAGLPLALTAAPASAAQTATVSVLHGVPGLTVDVYANGKQLVPDFAPGTLTDPLLRPARSYDIEVFANDTGPDGTPAIEKADVKVPAGANATLVAHLDAGGKPTLSAYVNSTERVAAGQARVTVRHTAAAPAVDVRANGDAVFSGLKNPGEESAEVPAGTIRADVVLAGTDTVAIGPANLDLGEGTSTVVYAWGNSDAGYRLATQSVTGLGSAPGGVNGGSAGLADQGLPAGALGVMGAAAVGAAFSLRRLAVARAER